MLRGILTDKCFQILLRVALAECRASVRIAAGKSFRVSVFGVFGRFGICLFRTGFCGKTNSISCAVVEYSIDKPADMSSAPTVHLLAIEAGYGVAIPGIDGFLGVVGQIDPSSSVDVVDGRFHGNTCFLIERHDRVNSWAFARLVAGI